MRTVNIIPMAGDGQRFLSRGILTPKPLILIDQIPMILKVTKNLPKSDLWIFICKESHIKNHSLDKLLKNEYKQSIIISVKENTQGQAATCLLAENYLNEDDQVYIYSCDTCLYFDHKKLLDKTFSNEATIITSKPNKYALNYPQQFGWVASKKNIITEIACKEKLISKKNGNVILGSFSFNNANLMIKVIKNVIDNKIKINNEYYVDTVMQYALKDDFLIYDFNISNYVSFGTPEEIEIANKDVYV